MGGFVSSSPPPPPTPLALQYHKYEHRYRPCQATALSVRHPRLDARASPPGRNCKQASKRAHYISLKKNVRRSKATAFHLHHHPGGGYGLEQGHKHVCCTSRVWQDRVRVYTNHNGEGRSVRETLENAKESPDLGAWGACGGG